MDTLKASVITWKHRDLLSDYIVTLLPRSKSKDAQETYTNVPQLGEANWTQGMTEFNEQILYQQQLLE